MAGRWPHGEEWLHEAASETYIPLLQMLHELYEEGIPCNIAIGITPILAEQLADADVQDHFEQFLANKIAAAEEDIALFNADPHLHYLATWYRDWYTGIRDAYIHQFNRDILSAFQQLQQKGVVELITSAATHAYLPLLATDRSIRAQLAVGIQSHCRHFGTSPRGIWLPECAYRPAFIEGERTRPGIEYFLEQAGIRFTFSETHAITGGHPVGVATGHIIGPYSEIKRRYVIPFEEGVPSREATTFQAYYLMNTANGEKKNRWTEVAVMGRNDRTGQQVWSEDWGYPGDFDYREFHKRASTSGLQYWRVTNPNSDLAHKEYYQPEWARSKCRLHAEHFTQLVHDTLREYHQIHDGAYGLVSANYDGELFGHWWFEGVHWLGEVLREIAERDEIELTTPSAHLATFPPKSGIHLPESSWGAGGGHFTWNNGDNRWMWRPIHELEQRLVAIANKNPDPSDDEKSALKQATRELLLCQSSDWPFLVSTGQAREYAIRRFSQHAERCGRLLAGMEKGKPDSDLAAEYWELDKVFPDLDHHLFKQ